MQIKTCYAREEDGGVRIGNEVFSYLIDDAKSPVIQEEDRQGRSLPYAEVTVEREGGSFRYALWEDLPMVWLPDGAEGPLLTLEGEHWLVRCVKLHAFTDEYDTLTTETEVHLFQRTIHGAEGDIFYLEDPLTGSGVVIVSETPDYLTAKLYVKGGKVTIENEKNAVAIGFCKAGEGEALCRSYLRHGAHRKELIAMSNTWGDRNGYDRVCEAFIQKEIDAAKEIGVDIVQIDDGWQKGKTGDPAIFDEKRRRCFEGDFWNLDEERFPHGMEVITDYAKAAGVKIGLWFAPDSHGTFSKLERDKEVLKKAYRDWGMRFFKLDMYWVSTRAQQNKMLELLDTIDSFGEDVAVQLDVTRGGRLNYLCGREHGSIFVENRYTQSGNSFPHRILRNLWMLGHHLPTTKLQFEVLNPDHGTDCYGADDVFAPARYDMDYLFASVMTANPLFWMEMQFLSAERKEQLKRIIPVWKEHRGAMAQADVMPIGQKPSGRSLTGFLIRGEEKTYLLAFREVTEEAEMVISVPGFHGGAEILAENGRAEISAEGKTLRIRFSAPRTYAFLELK